MSNSIINKVNSIANESIFQLKKHSPIILLSVGIGGVVASTIMACVATTKLDAIKKEAKDNIEQINKAANGEIELEEEYSEEDAKTDLQIVYIQTAFKLAKLYAPAFGIGISSIACIISAHSIMSNRAAALTAAYMTIDKSFKDFEKRVVEKYGEEEAKKLKYNIVSKEEEITTVDEETGETKIEKKASFVVKPSDISGYARFFERYTNDEDGNVIENVNWTPNNEYNIMFLKNQERYANDLLRTRKRLFLNEVYRMLGLPATKAGQVIGWVYDPNDSEKENYVDFGLYRDNLSYSDYVNGHDDCILVDFNVHGNIWESMK